MVNEQVILAAERLRDDLGELRKDVRSRYSAGGRPVAADDLKQRAGRLAESWLVEIAQDPDVLSALGSDVAADLSVRFQRLLTYSEHATARGKYEKEIRRILDNYGLAVLVPLKKARGQTAAMPIPGRANMPRVASAFVGQSFADTDKPVNDAVAAVLEAIGLRVVTGERPKADSISEKVKRLIDAQDVFVGIFTRREKIARKAEWTTSPWVIDEKAYALGRRKRLILVKELGVASIGGIQGDYEFIEFQRGELERLLPKLLQIFDIETRGLRG